MKPFEDPKIEVIRLDGCDVITASDKTLDTVKYSLPEQDFG